MADKCSKMKRGRNVFITVGTTEFDDLTRELDSCSSEFVNVLIDVYDCRSLTLQMGRGVYEPVCLPEHCSTMGISYSCFRFKSSLEEDMKLADLIISHCGAGSILEALGLTKPLIVVVNTTLQGNHQAELSDALSAEGYSHATTPSQLISLLKTIGDSDAVSSQERGGCLDDSSIMKGKGSSSKAIGELLRCRQFPRTDHDLFPTALDGWIFGKTEKNE